MFADVRNSSAAYTTAVRALNAPIGVWFSCFTQTSAPRRSHSRGHRNCGVGGMTAYTSSCAFLISSIVGKAVAANTSLAMMGSAPGVVNSLTCIQVDFARDTCSTFPFLPDGFGTRTAATQEASL